MEPSMGHISLKPKKEKGEKKGLLTSKGKMARHAWFVILGFKTKVHNPKWGLESIHRIATNFYFFFFFYPLNFLDHIYVHIIDSANIRHVENDLQLLYDGVFGSQCMRSEKGEKYNVGPT